MFDKDYPFAQWWVTAVGRPPLAGENALYVRIEELFEYAKQVSKEETRLHYELEATRAISEIYRNRLIELGDEYGDWRDTWVKKQMIKNDD